jgi:hypothetical protein
MKKYFVLLVAITLQATLHAQSNWAPLVSIEESIHLTDISPSYNYLNLSVPAANSGIRLGAHYVHDHQLSAEITLGVVGIGTPGSFSSKIVPVECVGHYNLIDGMELPILSKFNLDAGIGSGLAETDNGRFSFSEHFVIGASAELPSAVPFGTLIMGTRYTLFVNDYLDGAVVSGTSNDATLRFFTALRLDGTSKKLTKALTEAEATAKQLKTNLADSQKTSTEKIAKVEKEKTALLAERTALEDELDALKASQTQSQKDTTETNNAPAESKQFHVVIGSFPSQEMAENYAQSIESTTSIVNVSELNTYRVVLSIHNELNDALSALEEARKLTSKAWIAVQ